MLEILYIGVPLSRGRNENTKAAWVYLKEGKNKKGSVVINAKGVIIVQWLHCLVHRLHQAK